MEKSYCGFVEGIIRVMITSGLQKSILEHSIGLIFHSYLCIFKLPDLLYDGIWWHTLSLNSERLYGDYGKDQDF